MYYTPSCGHFYCVYIFGLIPAEDVVTVGPKRGKSTRIRRFLKTKRAGCISISLSKIDKSFVYLKYGFTISKFLNCDDLPTATCHRHEIPIQSMVASARYSAVFKPIAYLGSSSRINTPSVNWARKYTCAFHERIRLDITGKCWPGYGKRRIPTTHLAKRPEVRAISYL